MSRDAGLLLAARLTSALTTLAVLSLVARLRGPEALGLVALGFAAGAILSVLTETGVGGLLVRDGSRYPDEVGALFGGMFAARFVTVPVVLAFAWLAIGSAFPANIATVWLAAAGLVFQQWAELTRSVSLSRRRVGLLAAHTIAENLAWFAVIVGLLVAGAPIAVALAGGVTVCVLSVIGGLGIVRFVLGIRPMLPTATRTRRLLREGAPFAMFVLLAAAYSRIDTILVGLLVPGSAVVAAGAYFAASRLVAALEYLPETLSRSLLPELSRSFVSDPAGLRAILRRPTRLLLFVGVPIPFAMVVFGPWLMQVLFGALVGGYGWVLVGLAAVVPFRFFQWLFGVTLTSADAQWRRAVAAAIALLAVALVDALLLPRLGIVAAILGVYGATLIVTGLYTFGVARLVGSLSVGSDGVKALAAASAAVLAGLVARSFGSDPVGAFVFAVVYVLVVAIIARPEFRSGRLPGAVG
jgi:O-antigen/teichoic acid export membrane protein